MTRTGTAPPVPPTGGPQGRSCWFYKGKQPSEEAALAWLAQRGDEGSTWFPFPDTFCDPPGPDAVEPITVTLDYPPFHQEACLGMTWGTLL